MKNITIIIINFLFPLLLLAGSGQQDLIATADSAYNAENYRLAIKKYEQVLDQGYHASELYYNLGNAYFNLNDLPPAILNYERAKVLDPGDADINFNLRIANSMISDKIEAVPEIFYIRWWKALRDSFNMHTWTITSIILFMIVVLSAGFFFLSRSTAIRKMAFWTGVIFILLTAGSFSISYSKYNILSNHLEAIVFDPTITVKSSPNKLGKDLFVIHEGTKVYIIEEINDWANIRIANGSTGWMPLSSVKRI